MIVFTCREGNCQEQAKGDEVFKGEKNADISKQVGSCIFVEVMKYLKYKIIKPKDSTADPHSLTQGKLVN